MSSEIPNEIAYFGCSDSEDEIECTCNFGSCNANHNDTVSAEKSDDETEDLCDMDVLMDIKSVLERNSEVSYINALHLNQEMQKRLLELRRILVSILDEISKRYQHNADLLLQNFKRTSGIGRSGAYLKGATFYFKGNMFFRDKNYRSAPNNPDYIYRSTVQKEMFPMDFDLQSRHIWSISDKVSIVKGVKAQVLDFLRIRDNRQLNKKDKNESVIALNELHSEKLVNLMEQVDDSFKIDWNEICAVNLRYRHSPTSCQAMWNIYLRPQLRRCKWTDDENEKLLAAVKEYNFQNWGAIAERVGYRSDYQCFVQFQTHVQYMMPERWTKWEKEDNQLLIDLVQKYTFNGVIDWRSITCCFPNRPKPSIIAHYTYSLNPRISHKPFTPEEDILLLAAVKQYGPRFTCFPRNLFPNRSVIQLRNRYVNTLQNRHNLTSWSLDDDKKLMEFITQHGTSSWLQCAEFMGNHQRTSCRTRFLTIKKFFEKNPNATLEDLPRRNKLVVNNVITAQNWEQKVKELQKNPNAKLVETKRDRRKKKNIDKETPKKGKKTNRKQNDTLLTIEASKEIHQNIDTQLDPQNEAVPSLTSNKGRDNKLDYFRTAYDAVLDPDREVRTNFKMAKCPEDVLCRTAGKLRVGVPQSAKHMPYEKYLSTRGRNKICKSFQSITEEAEFEISDSDSVPPNYSTLVGLRAQLIQSTFVNCELSPEVKELVASSKEAQLFVERYRMTFDSTVKLAKSEPSDETLKRISGELTNTTECDFKDIRSYFQSKYLNTGNADKIQNIPNSLGDGKDAIEIPQEALLCSKKDIEIAEEEVKIKDLDKGLAPLHGTIEITKLPMKREKTRTSGKMESAQCSTKVFRKRLKSEKMDNIDLLPSKKKAKVEKAGDMEIIDAVNKVLKSGTSIKLVPGTKNEQLTINTTTNATDCKKIK